MNQNQNKLNNIKPMWIYLGLSVLSYYIYCMITIHRTKTW